MKDRSEEEEVEVEEVENKTTDELLIEYTDFSKYEARSVIYLLSNARARQRDIEDQLKLSQPVVSIAINGLKDRGLIETEKKKKEGKGRPEHIYSLKVDELLDYVRDVKEDIEDDLEKLEMIMERWKVIS